METTPLITVIIPVYKAESYLDFCIQSILNQTFRDYELILIDDGSPDRCGVMCDAWAAKDDRIHVIHQRNSGVSAARNAGIRASCGMYVMFVDSDDFIEPDMLEDLSAIARNTNADITGGSYIRTEDYITQKPQRNHAEVYEGTRQLKLLFEINGPKRTAIIANWGKLYRRTLFTQIQFPEGRVYEDEATVHQFLRVSRKLAFIDYPYYHYVVRPNSIVTSRSIKSYIDKRQALQERVEALTNTEFERKAALYYHAYCVDFLIDVCADGRIDTDKDCMTFIDSFLRGRDAFWRYLPWHQKLCICLIATRNRRVIHWLAKQDFAPGRRLLMKAKSIMNH